MSLKTLFLTKFIEGKLPNWMYRLIGKEVSKKMENKMEDTPITDTKPLWKSKTVWVAIITAIVGAIQPISTALGHPLVIPSWVLEFLAGMGLYSLRTADTKIS